MVTHFELHKPSDRRTKCKMADCHHLKLLNRHISAAVLPFVTKFGTVTNRLQKRRFLKIHAEGRRNLEIPKIAISWCCCYYY